MKKKGNLSRIVLRNLASTDSADIGSYKDNLDSVFENNKIHNIAISGTYGAGKSSLIESYEKSRPDIKALHISLAHFNDINAENNEGIQQDIINKLEGKILNQLLHQVNENRIPQTNFRIKKRNGRLYTCIKTLMLMSGCLAFLHILMFAKWKELVGQVLIDFGCESLWASILDKSVSSAAPILSIAILCLIILFCIYRFVRRQGNLNPFKKIDVKGVLGVEIFEESNESYFDKYLNEVLYLFDNSGMDIIVFEDLDRFNSLLIFEKLREINGLINQKRKKRHKRIKKYKPLRFFYLMKDDIFSSLDRTKFFEAIIPVVPVVDTSNAGDKLVEEYRLATGMEKEEAICEFSDRFINDVSLYIEDYRLVKNVVNEYLTYKNNLKKNDVCIDKEKLLAMMLYKNLMPRDFALLQNGRGYVRALFAKRKKELAKIIKGEYEKRINELERKISEAQNEKAESIRELNALFFRMPSDRIANINGKSIQEYKSHVDLVNAIIDSGSYTVREYSGYISTRSARDAINELKNNKEYILRKERIEERDRIDEYRQECNLLKERIDDIDVKLFRELIPCVQDDVVWDVEMPASENKDYKVEILQNHCFPLLKYLIRSGYIDETYSNYMTYFYPNSIALEDKNFLLSVFDRKALPYGYKLKNMDKLINRLGKEDFYNPAICNYDLMEYLIREKKQDYLIEWFQQINKGNTKDNKYDFIIGYWMTRRTPEELIKLIFNEQVGWFKLWDLWGLLSADQWRNLAWDVLNYLEPDSFASIGQWFERKVVGDEYFLSAGTHNIERLIEYLSRNKLRFCRINIDGIEYSDYDRIYSGTFYELNQDTLHLWMKAYYQVSEIDYRIKNYTVLSSDKESPLYCYVQDNIEKYFDILQEIGSDTFEDDEILVLELLRNDRIPLEAREWYLNRSKMLIHKVIDVNEEFWEIILTQRLMEYSVANLISVFQWIKTQKDEARIQEVFIDYINSDCVDTKMSYNDLLDHYERQKANDYLRFIIATNEIGVEQTIQLLRSVKVVYSEFRFPNIQDERFAALINLGIIRMNQANLVFIREHYDKHVSEFVIKNMTDFVALLKEGDVEIFESELDELLLSKRLRDIDKLNILEATTNKIRMKIEYSTPVLIQILKNHFDIADIKWIVTEFKLLPGLVKSVAIAVIKKHLDGFVDCLEDGVLVHTELLAACVEDMDYVQIDQALPYWEKYSDFELIRENKRPSFENSVQNKVILDKLVKQGMISSVKLDKSGLLRVYPKKN